MNAAGLMTGMMMGGAMGNQMAGMMNQMGNQMNSQMQQGSVPPPPPTAAPFMIYLNGAQAGPFDMQQLSQLASSGQINPQTYVWRQGMANWALAGQVPELQALFMPATPPPPPVPGAPGAPGAPGVPGM